MRSYVSAILCALLVWVAQTDARNLYVALNGNNSNPGSLSAPWRTIAYAVSSASGTHAGDTIIVRQGNYPETVTPQVSGTSSQPIILRRLKDEQVSLDPGSIHFDSGINYWKVWGFTIKHSSSNGIQATGTHAANSLFIQRCTVSNNKQDGFYIGGSVGGIQIRDCNIQFNGEWNGVPQTEEGHGIVVYSGGPGQLIVKNNLIANNWHKGFSFGSAVEYSGDGSQVDSNFIINNYESGCDFSPDNSYFRYNYISRNGVRDTESGEWGDKGFMTTNYCNGSTIAFNIFKSNGGNEVEPNGSNCHFYNNVLYKDVYYTAVPGSPYQSVITIYDSYGTGNQFRNNIICNMLSQADHQWAIITEVYQGYTAQTWSNNLYWCPNSTQPSPNNKPFKFYGASGPGGTYKTLAELQSTWPNQESNSIYVAPGFVSVADSNFHLAANSPAIDAGTNVGFPYVGQAPDIGRYEYGSISEGGGSLASLVEGSGAVLTLKGIGAEGTDVSVDPITDRLTMDAGNGTVAGAAPTGTVSLEQNSPNPFNPTTSIRFSLPNDGMVKLSVYSITGQLVQTLVNGQQQAGTHEVTFDGSKLASGVYLYRLDAGNVTQIQKMTLTK